MKSFAYANPTSKEEAVQILARHPQAAVLAGGTDLISLLKDGVESANVLVSLKSIPELRELSQSGDAVRVGAMVSFQDLIGSELIRERYPLLIQAAQGVTSPQIRNMGTVGGDLLQRPRCWYYRNGFGLLAKHGGSSMVPSGDNRYHAILGNSGDAHYVHPSSLAPALIALESKAVLLGTEGKRTLPLPELYRVPEQDGEKENQLQAGEILVAVEIPKDTVSGATYEVRQREALDWPLAAASVALRMQGEQIEQARIVLGHVAPTPWIAERAASMLSRKRVDRKIAEQAAEAALQGARPLSHNGYKVRLAKTAVKRAILLAAGREI